MTIKDNVDALFNAEFDKAIAEEVARSGLPVSSWFRGGVTLPETMVEQWRELGPRAVRNFIDWWEASELKVWITPDGRPAIELDLDVMFGRVLVKMVIDLVAVTKDGKLIVIDTKSGAQVPESLQQVALYACGVQKAYGKRPELGAFFMARGAGKNKDIFLTEPVSLGSFEYSYGFFTGQFEALERAIEAGEAGGPMLLANVGKHCHRCEVADHCYAFSTPKPDRLL